MGFLGASAWRRTTSAASLLRKPARAVIRPAGANIARSPVSLRSTVAPCSQPRNPLRRGCGVAQRSKPLWGFEPHERASFAGWRPSFWPPSALPRNSETFSLPFWSQKGRPLWMQPIIKGRHRMVVTPARHNIKFKFPASSKRHPSSTPDAHGNPNPPRQGWPRPPRSHPQRPHRRPQHSWV